MFERSQERGDEVRDREREFADLGFETSFSRRVSENYYNLLKQYEEENVILVKD